MFFENEFSGHFYFPAYIYLYSFETVCECIVAQLCLNLYNPIGRTIVYQAPLSMVFSRQEYWSGVPSPSLGGNFGECLKSHLVFGHIQWLTWSRGSEDGFTQPMDLLVLEFRRGRHHRMLQPRANIHGHCSLGL